MASAQIQTPWMTPEDYLALEREAETKSEYLAGRIYAMSGATREHNLITINVATEMRAQLKGKPCETYASDMRVQVSQTGLYTYPDVVVVCGQPQWGDAEQDTLLNPTLIVEVLSKSTEAYDRGEKFAHYRSLQSLADYVLIAQDKPRIEHYIRQSDGQWLYSAVDGLEEVARFASINCHLALSEVYDRIVFPPAPAQEIDAAEQSGDRNTTKNMDKG